MNLTMSRATLPIIHQYLTSLFSILALGEAHAASHGIDPDVLVGARLYPDMFPLSSQVQSACDFAKGAVARLAGVAVPAYADDERSFPELQARIAKTLEFITTVKSEQLDGSERREVSLKFGGAQLRFDGETYLFSFALPSLIFHVTAAYAILRHNGVVLGKADFLGPTVFV